MARTGGWRRAGSKGRFRYLDGRGNRIADPAKIERIESLVIPPAWKDVWISPRAAAKLQATGLDKAGRRQYLYHPDFRAQQEQAKFDRLVRFAEQLPGLRMAMGEHMTLEPYERERVCAVAIRLINMAWFRVGTDRYAKASGTHGVTTLSRRHVKVRGNRVTFSFRAKHRVAETDTEAKRVVAKVMRTVGERLGNTPAVARASYVSPAVVEQYLDGRTLEEFRPRHLRIVNARDIGLNQEEQALVSLLRSWRIKRALKAA